MNQFKLLFVAVLLGALSIHCSAQETFPVNGVVNKSSVPVAFKNVTLHIDATSILENATFVIQNGRVLSVNQEIPKSAITIDGSGKHIYASFIDLNSNYGMPVAKSAERSGYSPQYESNKKGAYGWNETLNPERKASLMVKHDEKKAGSYRASGFGSVLTHYGDGIHRGSGTLIGLGVNENRNLLEQLASAHLSFRKGKSRQSYPNSLMGVTALIRQTNYDALWYSSPQNLNEENLTLSAWNELLDAEVPHFFETTDKLDVLRADRIGDEFGTQYVFMGTGNEYQRLEDIKNTEGTLVIPVNFPKAFDVSDPFLANTIELEELKHWELAPYNAFFLADNEIPFCFTAKGLKDKSQFLPNVRKAVMCGLSEAEALAALTTVPASLLNIEDEIGRLDTGFVASFIVTNGNLFDPKTQLLENWVQGEKFVIQEEADESVSGEYNLSIDNLLFRLRIKEDGNHLVLNEPNMDGHDSLGVSASVLSNQPFVTINFSLADEEGLYRLTGSNLTEGKILSGTGISPKGDSFDWVAVRQIRDEKPAENTIKEEVKPESFSPYDLLIYPFKAYGSDDTLKQETLLVKNATIWTCDSIGKIERGEILVSNGKIIAVGETIDLEGVYGKKWAEVEIKEMDGYGLHVTPGIIDEHSHIAISRGVNEGSQASTAEVRIGDSVNSEDVNIYRQLSGGVTTSQLLHGSANPIGGQSALIKLRWGYSPEEMKFKEADGFIKFALGENVKQSNWGSFATTRFPQSRMGVEQVYYDHFHRAAEYDKEWSAYRDQVLGLTKRQIKKGEFPIAPRVDLEMEALSEILRSERFITCHSYMQHEINMLMHVADSMKFRLNTFTHILEGYKVADKMKKHGAGASSFSDWWAYKYEVKDAIPHNGAILWEQGITVAYNSDDAEMARRLNHEAAKAVKYGGVPEEEALKFVTLNPAILLHIDDRVGSLKTGKDADFVIWNAHPLSVYAKSLYTYVDGICFYSLERDLKLREYIKKERNRLIQLMAVDPSGDLRMPGQKRAQHYHCNTLTNECE